MGIEPIYNSSAGVKNDYLGKISVNWVDFKKYIENCDYNRCYSSNLFNYAVKYSNCLINRDMTEIKELPKTKQATGVKALSALSKFLGNHEEFKLLVKNFGLSWTGRSADDLIIDRLSKTADPDNVFQWIKDVKEACPEYSIFMDFIAVTGLRFSEAVESYNIIIRLTNEGNLDNYYYHVKSGLLEHFRFKELFIRSSKKAFLSYVPLELVRLIGKQKTISKNHFLNRALARKHIVKRFSDVRENHASFCTQWLRPEEIDLFHGRVTGSVFKVHYYNPNLVSDLYVRVAKAAQAILLKIDSPLVMKKELGGEM